MDWINSRGGNCEAPVARSTYSTSESCCGNAVDYQRTTPETRGYRYFLQNGPETLISSKNGDGSGNRIALFYREDPD